MNRLKPSFMIIGERKCGTSSLFRYLCEHPQILPPSIKEPNFFSQYSYSIDKKFKEYLHLFPNLDQPKTSLDWIDLNERDQLTTERIDFELGSGTNYITGEASANTFSTVDPRKIHKYFPEMKFILLMRNPVSRALSHHAMHRRFKKEGRWQFQWVGSPNRDFKIEMVLRKTGLKGPYLSPGCYLENLRKWLLLFPLKNFLILTIDELKPNRIERTMEALYEFLSVEPISSFELLKHRYNAATYPQDIDPQLHIALKEFFEKHNTQLQSFINRKFGWNEV